MYAEQQPEPRRERRKWTVEVMQVADHGSLQATGLALRADLVYRGLLRPVGSWPAWSSPTRSRKSRGSPGGSSSAKARGAIYEAGCHMPLRRIKKASQATHVFEGEKDSTQ